MDHEDATALLRAGTRRAYRPGTVMITEGDIPEFVLLIRTGRASVSVNTVHGTRLILALRGPGDIIGELSAIDGGTRSATVTALVRTEAVVIPVGRFTETLTRRPAANRVIMRALGGRLRDSDSQRRALVSATLLQRVAQVLTELADRAGRVCDDGVRIDLPLPQHELAALVGATREGTAKALGLLRRSGVVRTAPRRVIVTDQDLLKAIGTV
ncbi:Crp/Fnr family transcriptional regulator [Actinoplanes sp. NBRC 101535]|uniref:Crp/Fnr family transcriptional regulator n=1 Tax=Actinoplanes sp. NBRC 101535 TaxID=3032196 RepID=UPI002555F073|nr:Crp/Fnr family transcriptional regulator [Actinoplanes sp. NBRC 101535]